MKRVAILGAGAWGTALAVHLAVRATRASPVLLWARDATQVSALRATRVNERYLPGVPLPSAVQVTDDLAACATADQAVRYARLSQAELMGKIRSGPLS